MKIRTFFKKAVAAVRKYKVAVICLVFVVIFVTGIATTYDYGLSTDEPTQRKHSLITYRYVYTTLTGKPLDIDVQDLEDYDAKYYGVAIQLPMVFIEHLNNFSMSNRDIYHMRHVYTFVVYFVALVCFFFMCKMLLKRNLYALLGALSLYLYPRFYAHSHYNIKDLMFTSLFIISLFAMIAFLKYDRKWWLGLIFGFTAALATNSRVIGVMVPCAAICLMILEDISVAVSRKKAATIAGLQYEMKPRRRYAAYAILAVAFFGFYVLITPAIWSAPITGFVETLIKFSSYEKWNGTMQFLGDIITKKKMPWYYLPVWMGFTIPLVLLVLFVVGIVFLVIRSVRPSFSGIITHRLTWLMLGLWVLPFGMVVIKPSTIYAEWRHVYFLFPLMVYMALFGLARAVEWLGKGKLAKARWAVPAALGLSLVLQAGWIIRNHPHENVYFNVIGRQHGSGMARDEWRTANYQLLLYLLDNVEGELSVALVDATAPHQLYMLTPEQRARIISVNSKDADAEAEYITSTFRYTTGNDYVHEGFEEIYAIWVDGFKVGTLQKRIS